MSFNFIPKLKWLNANIEDHLVKVYRDTAPYSKENLPPPLATLPKGSDEFIDTTAEINKEYFYRFSVVNEESEVVSKLYRVKTHGYPRWIYVNSSNLSRKTAVFNMDTLEPISLMTVVSSVTGGSFSKDGKYLAMCGNRAPYLAFYETSSSNKDWKDVTLIPASQYVSYTVSYCSFSPDNKYFAFVQPTYTTTIGRYYIYDTETWTQIHANNFNIPGGSYYDLRVCWFNDSKKLIVFNLMRNSHQIVEIGETITATPWSLPTDKGELTDFAISKDDAYLVVTHSGGSFVSFYNTNTWEEDTSISLEIEGGGHGVAFSNDGQYMAVSHKVGLKRACRLSVYDTQTWERVFYTTDDRADYYRTIAFTPDDGLLVIAPYNTSTSLGSSVWFMETTNWTELPEKLAVSGIPTHFDFYYHTPSEE